MAQNRAQIMTDKIILVQGFHQYIILQMDKDELVRKLDSLESKPYDQTENLISQIIQIVQTAGEDLPAINWGLSRIAETTTKTRQVEPLEKTKYYEILMKYVVDTALKFDINVGADGLKFLFDSGSQFYKRNLHDNNLEFPITRERPLALYLPVIGQECDCVRPGLTTTSKMGWTRCKVVSINNSAAYTVRFANSTDLITISDGYWFAPLGSRTEDFQWRQNLKVGDLVDALDNKLVWLLSTITQIQVDDKGTKTVRISFRYFDQKGDRTDSQGNRFFGWGSNEDEWMDFLSPGIQKPGKMRRKLCYYASTSHNQFYLDDNYDIVYQKQFRQKPFYAMLRSSFTRSQVIYSLFNHFVEQGGMVKALNFVKEGKNVDAICQLAIAISFSSFMPPRMVVEQLYKEYLESMIQFVKNNIKAMNNQRLDMCFWFFQSVGRRTLTLCEKHDMIQNLKKFLIPKFLVGNLEKQLIALRYIYDLIKPMRPHTQQSEFLLVNYIKENNLFYIMYQQNQSHEQVLFRSTSFLQYMIKKQIISLKQLDYLWNLFPLNDAKGRVTLQKLIGDVIHQMNAEQITYILDRLLEVESQDFTLDHLQLLHIMKNKNKIQGQSYTRALNLLWLLLTVKSSTVKPAIQSEIQKIFKSFINNIQDERVKFQLLDSMFRCIKETTKIQREPSFLRQYILSYKNEDQLESTYPNTRATVVNYLHEKGIYPICFKHLTNTKNPQKIQQILNLLTDLIKNDTKNDLSSIAKQVYKILGPSETTLKWLSSLSSHISTFIQQLFTQTKDFEPFADISLSSFSALTNMLNQINRVHGKRKFVKQKVEILDIVEIQWNSFIYTTCNPNDLIGIRFLYRLLEIVKNPLVYTMVIQFIIKLIVHLDEKLQNQVQPIRKQFLKGLISEFQIIDKQPEFNEAIKHKLQRTINMLTQFIEEAEVNGLKGMKPYFQDIQGQNINVKIENNVAGSKKPKESELVVSDNIKLQDLKYQIAKKLQQQPENISLLKGKKVYQSKLNGKSLSQLKITKGDVVRVEKAKIPEALRASLLNDDKTELSTQMRTVSERIYSMFADLESNSILSKANFFKICSDIAKSNNKQDEAKKMAEQDNQQNKDIKMTKQQLNKQFVDRIKLKQDSIWTYVQSLGLQQGLKIENKQNTKNIPITALPRYILADPIVYDTLFSLLRNSKIQQHLQIYQLLCSLPTDQRLKREIFNDWSHQRFNKSRSIYEINYLLGLTEAELQKNEEFSLRFVNSGLQTLINYVKQYKFEDTANSVYSLNQMQKVVIGTIIRIFAGFSRIFNQPSALSTHLYYQKINQFDLVAFIEMLNKKIQVNQHDVDIKSKLDKASSSIPIGDIASICSGLLNNLVSNYVQMYIKEITPEIARLSGVMNENYPQDIKILLNGIKVDSINLRRTCGNLLYLQAIKSSDILGSILNQMLLSIPTQNKTNHTQYFELLSKLIEFGIKNNTSTIDFRVLAEQLLNRVLKYNSDERRTTLSPDKILLGLLSVIQSILTTKPQIAALLTSYKWKLLDRCLFYVDPSQQIQQMNIQHEVLNNPNQPQFFENYINCKSSITRKVLINVIIQLAKHHEENQQDFLQAVVEPLLKQLPQKPKKPNSKGMMVGIQNLGGICYLSSMCQSLNSISAFRNGLSMIQKPDSKIINATQRMLAYLLFSQRQDYVPTPFLQSFNQPINPNIQQDTTQFLNLYFDQLEHQLQGTPYASLLRQLFQGSTIIQMICHNCKNKRERKQQYFCYSVGVRQKPTLQLALQGMHEGDIINDYKCQQCGVKSDLTKRSVLGDLPNFLFLHLQRIVNLDFYRYTKIHSKCLFPLELNIEPFTKEGVQLRQTVGLQYLKKLQQNEEENKKFQQLCRHGKPQKHYIYNLKAIIVHSGSAEGGHYYTIMKRDGGWIKLDDSKASVFTLQQFQTECYGGPFNVIGEWGIEESKNAYVLLYQKQIKTPINLDFSLNPNQISKFDLDLETATKGIQYDRFKTFNTQPLYKQVWMDNHRLMLQSHVFGDVNSKQFIKLVQTLVQHSNSPKKTQLICEIFFKICCWSNQTGNLMDQLQKCNPGYDIFLKYAKDFQNMFNIIFHPEKSIRASMAKFLTTVVLNSIKQGPADEVYKLLDSFLSKLNTEVAKNWLRVQSYFSFFQSIITRSASIPSLYNFFIDKHLISVLIDFILQKQSPLKISIKKHSMGNKFNRVQFQSGVRIIYWLLQRSYYFNGNNEEQIEGELFHLSDNDVFALSCMNFYTKMIKEGQNVQTLAIIIQKLAFQNYGFVQAISRALLRTLNDSMERLNQSTNTLVCIEKILLNHDSLWKKKSQFLLGIGQPYSVSKDNTFPSLDIDRFTYNSTLEDIFPIECIMNLAFISRQRYPEVSLYLVHLMLKVALSHSIACDYIKIQPPPNYLYNHYADWWNQFIPFASEIITTKTIKQLQLNRLKKQCAEMLESFKIKNNPLFQNNVISGKIVKTRKQVTKHQEIGVSFVIEDVEVYVMPSHPSEDYQSNGALSKFLTHHRLQDANDTISAESSILKFMSTSKPALAITENQKIETASNKAQTSEVNKINDNRHKVHFDAQKNSQNVQFNWEQPVSKSQSAGENTKNQPVLSVEIPAQQKQKTEQKIMDIQYKNVNLQQPITTLQYFRHIIINNLTDENMWVKLIIEDVDYLQQNCLLPHLYSNTVLAHKGETMVLYRLDPSKQIGHFKYIIDVEDSNKKKKKVASPGFFKLYGDMVEKPMQVQVQDAAAMKQQIPQNNAIDSELKLCPICTFGNDPMAQKCEICQSAFM